MKGNYLSPEKDGFYGVWYPNPRTTDAAFIAMLGDSCDDHLAKTGVKWLHAQNVSVLAMSPAKKDYSHHNLPLERFEHAISFLHENGITKIGILGSSTTGMLALIAASYYHDITMTIALSPSDFVMEGFYQEKGIERPGDQESTVSYGGEPLPYLPFCYRHPEYWKKLREEAKHGRNMVASREMFDRSERLHPITEAERIKVEQIRGTIILIGAADDVLWDTCRYIKRMRGVLDFKSSATDCHYLLYQHGTHFVFPESMLKMALPIGSSLFPKMAFRAARQFPRECRETRIDIDRKLQQAIQKWVTE